jgi:transcriptional regulator with XRE-family HTH domain
MKSKNIALASKIKKLRQKANYLQKQVAQYLNVVESTYSQYESGKSRPDFETLKKLATLYNVTLDYLLGLYRPLSPTTIARRFEDFYNRTTNLKKICIRRKKKRSSISLIISKITYL